MGAETFGTILGRHGLSGEVAVRLERYLELLERWNRTHNLVRYGEREELVVRHVLEALEGLPHLGEGRGTLLDVGSGAGLPGVPLLAARPGWRGVLVEPRQKRWAFLRLVVRELDLQAEVLPRRFEELGPDTGPLDVVVARALGRYGELLRWAGPRLAPGGRVLLWLGAEEARSLESLERWRVVLSPLPDLERGVLAVFQPCFT